MGLIDELLKELAIGSITKERLELLKDKLEKVESENETLRQENERLKQENSRLKQQLSIQEEFTEESGVLFKKKKDGNFEKYAYCPICKLAMLEIPVSMQVLCTKCKYRAPFKSDELNGIQSKAVLQYFERNKK